MSEHPVSGLVIRPATADRFPDVFCGRLPSGAFASLGAWVSSATRT